MRTFLLGCLCCGLAAAQTAAPPLRALILSGRNNHDWRATTPMLRQILLDTGRFDVRVNEEPAGMSAATLAPYDIVLLDYNGARWGTAAEEALVWFVRAGKGLVAVHAASYAFGGLQVLGDRHARTGIVEPPWPEYSEMIGATWSEQAPRTGHGPMRSFRVRFTDREHPIARGLAESFIATDELYRDFRMRPGARVLATAYDDPADAGNGKHEPLLWTVRYGQGRVFHTALGHDVAAMREPGFQTTLARGAEWAASGAVTLPAEPGARGAAPVRLLVVTGGHAYETSFYTLFEGRREIRWTHAFSNTEAFRSDLRDRYDALLLYDMSREIGERERAHLRAFLESGKGMVVLHHALADYNGWPWWSEEVVGGKYLLKPEAGRPASTFRHDQEIFIETAQQHPVTAGVGPLHLYDEVYKGMWISPKVKVLLKTAHPESDPAVAWISPYAQSRVAVIQPGHGRESHLHPGYGTLVRNAVLWAAGRTKGTHP
jgi:hypothetical protein